MVRAPGALALVGHVVGRVGEDQVGQAAVQRPPEVVGPGGVSAEQAVVAQEPEIARAREGIGWRGRGLVGEGGGRARSGEEVVDLARLEADQVEVDPESLKVGDLGGEQALVPAGVERELVVGQQVGPLLGLAQAGKLDHRHRGQARASWPRAAGRGRR